jgi:hypothetical protein
MIAGAGFTKMGSVITECPWGQQECVLNLDVCPAIGVDAESVSGALTPHSAISTIAAAMNLVFTQARQSVLD